MPDGHQLLLFVLAGWLLNLTPGPDVLYIVSNSLRGGRRAGVVAGLGITAGCFVHVFAAALGVGALLAASSLAFDVLKWLGAAYLFWIGARLLFMPQPEAAVKELAEEAAAPEVLPNLRGVFVGGFLTNVLNPKVALFFLAFVPQFIAPDASDKTGVFLALGILFNVNSIPVNTGWALAAAWMARREAVQRSLRWLDRVAGLVFIGFGLRLAVSDNRVRP
jgi:RhtB (resistance to homoserine/threonine) family protein